jgi:hypothetical protein
MAIQLLSDKVMNKKISHLPGVKASVRAEGKVIAGIASARLAPHRKTGQAHIEVSHGATDTYVSLVDPAALSIEFGHFLGSQSRGLDRRFVRGLHLFIEWYHEGVL